MALDKNDLKAIEQIVGGVEKRLGSRMDKFESELKQTRGELKETRSELKQTKNEIISVITREVVDLAEINRAVIARVDKVDELEKRIIRIEAHLKLDVAV